MGNADKISQLKVDNKNIVTYLIESGQPSYASSLESYFPKILLLSCASYFEDSILSIIKTFFSNCSQDNEMVNSFIQIKSLNRQYHTLFNWKDTNANSFFSLFGSDFKKEISSKVDENLEIADGMESFLFIGKTRNYLVHNNFIDYDFEYTIDDIYTHFEKAIKFVEFLETEFKDKI